jgi:DNA segregation ATPase FtsK/SpoIIIE-like protein
MDTVFCHIILVVDEFADLIMTAGKLEVPIARLAQISSCDWYSPDYYL